MSFCQIVVGVVSTLLLLTTSVKCWDNQEMQMFDLVEDLKVNFYEFLGVTQNATSAEIRRAYRKKSLLHHPDKNAGDKEAEKTFRQLVAVNEILKDEKMREKYNDVLVNGLPTWRQPIFYYRQLRKVGLMETILLVFIITTVGHYFVLWGSFFEKKLNAEEFLSTVYKKNKTKRKQRDVVDSAIQEELKTIPRPRFKDVWPIAFTCFTYRFIRDFPSLCKSVVIEVKRQIEKLKEDRQKKIDEKEELEKMVEEDKMRKEMKKKKKAEKAERQRAEHAANASLTGNEPVVYSSQIDVQESEPVIQMKTGDWDDQDWINLTNAMARIRQGVPERWQRIAERCGRTVEQVTQKVKEMRERGDMPMTSSVQHSVSGLNANVLNGRVGGGITMRDSAFEIVENEMCGTSSEEEDEYDSAKQRRQARRRKKRQTGKRPEIEDEDDNATVISNSTEAPSQELKEAAPSFPDNVYSWSQSEQRALETAMKKFTKGTHDRWDRISDCIGTRTKTECIDRARFLMEKVKSKSK